MTELNATTGALVRVIPGSTYKLHGTGLIASNGIDVWVTNLRGTTLAEISATTGNFIKDVKVSSLGIKQVNSLPRIPRTCGPLTASPTRSPS